MLQPVEIVTIILNVAGGSISVAVIIYSLYLLITTFWLTEKQVEQIEQKMKNSDHLFVKIETIIQKKESDLAYLVEYIEAPTKEELEKKIDIPLTYREEKNNFIILVSEGNQGKGVINYSTYPNHEHWKEKIVVEIGDELSSWKKECLETRILKQNQLIESFLYYEEKMQKEHNTKKIIGERKK